MQTRTTARVVGTLFVIATAAGVLSVALLGSSETISAQHDLAKIHYQVATGSLMVLVMAAAIAMIPPMLFPVLKEYNEALALGYVVARGIEVVLLLPAAIGPLLLLSMASPQSEGAPNLDGFQYVRALSQHTTRGDMPPASSSSAWASCSSTICCTDHASFPG